MPRSLPRARKHDKDRERTTTNYVRNDPSNELSCLSWSGKSDYPAGLTSKIANTHRRPVLTFYLAAPQRMSEHGSDFRTAGAEVTAKDDGLLNAIHSITS